MANSLKFDFDISHEKNIPQSSQVGVIKCSQFSCAIVLSNKLLKEKKAREIYVIQYENQFMIVVSDSMLSKIQTGKAEALFCIYHELGHIANGDFTIEKLKRAQEARFKAIQQGHVVQEELEADKFAVQYVGKKVAIDALQELLVARLNYDLKNKKLGHTKSVHAFKEYNLRIEAIKNYE